VWSQMCDGKCEMFYMKCEIWHTHTKCVRCVHLCAQRTYECVHWCAQRTYECVHWCAQRTHRVAQTQRMPEVAGHFSQKSH